MGRTLPSMTMQIQIEQDSWSAFRRTLRKEDREAFDALWRSAREQVAACAMARRALPFEAMVMAMLLELAKQNMLLNRQLAEQAKSEHKK